jgi:hypothetical protein
MQHDVDMKECTTLIIRPHSDLLEQRAESYTSSCKQGGVLNKPLRYASSFASHAGPKCITYHYLEMFLDSTDRSSVVN